MCKWYHLLYELLPFIRRWIASTHMETCPQCQDRYSWNEFAETLRKDRESWTLHLWPGVQTRIRQGMGQLPFKASPKPSPILVWRWFYGMGILFILVMGILFFRFQTLRPVVNISSTGTDSSAAFVLVSAKIEGEKAKTYVFHPCDSQVVIVWFQKT